MARAKLDRPNPKLAKRGDFFVIQYWWEGRAHRVSTGATGEREARRALAAWHEGWGKQAPPSQPTIGDILDGYSRDREGNADKPLYSPATLRHCVAHLKRHLGDLAPEFVTRETSREYARKRRAEGFEVGPQGARRRKPVADGTIIRELVTLRAALGWAVGQHWLQAEPYIETPSAPPPADRWLKRDEAARLVASCVDFHVKVFALLALHTAARSGAILGLTWDRVDLDRGRIDYGTGRGNKGRVRGVPISDELMAVLQIANQLAQSDYVVEFAGRPVGSVKTGFNAACRRAGLTGVSPKVLRHTAATWMAQNGVDLWDIAGYLGHKDTRMVERVYGHHCPNHLRRASAAIGRVAPIAIEAKVRVKKPRNG